jgi:prepilin-type N-terminal cleavage/methylation domain-containing protein
MRNEKGFTLLELLTVGAILGLLAAVTVPSLRSYTQSTGLRSLSDQLAGDLWYARQRAIATSVPYSVAFDPDANTYDVFRDDGAGDPDDAGNGEIDFGEQVVRTRPLGPAFLLSEVDLDPDNVVIFMRRGTLMRGTTGGSITISDRSGRTRTLEVLASGLCRAD